jgi:hypothetical protein
MAASLEELAYESSLRSLDRQEALVDELRARTGLLLAVASLAATLGGRASLNSTPRVELLVIGVAFVVSIAACLFILIPKKNRFFFSVSGPAVYEELFEFRADMPEIWRRLSYDLERFWRHNDEVMQPLFRAYWIAAGALVIEIGALLAAVGGNLR